MSTNLKKASLLLCCSTLWVLASDLRADGPDANQADAIEDPALLRAIADETGLPYGVMPKGATEAQRRLVRQKRAEAGEEPMDRGQARPAPGSGYRGIGEFEPSSAFVVSTGEWGFSAMLKGMVMAGTAEGGAPVIVLTNGSASSCESTLSSWGIGSESAAGQNKP